MMKITEEDLAKVILSTPVGADCFFYAIGKGESDAFRYGAMRQILFDSEVLTLNMVSGGSPWIAEIRNDPDLSTEERIIDTLQRFASFYLLERFFVKQENNARYNSAALLSQHELISMLEEWGAHDRAMSHVRDYYEEKLERDPIWRYPISLDTCNGGFIVPVKEGYLFIPYDEMDAEDYEILMLDKVSLMDAESCDFMIGQLQWYADALSAELREVSQELKREAKEET